MVEGPTFDWERALGNVGESATRKRLSYFSAVTKLEDDVAIDFHCQLRISNRFSGKVFYVQAKGTEHFDSTWRANVPKSIVAHWILKLEDPVYLIVYDEKTNECYWMSVEDNRYKWLGKFVRSNVSSKTVSITMDKSHIFEDGKDKNTEFIQKIIEDKLSIEQFWGRPRSKGEGYIQQLPPPPRSPYEARLTVDNVRVYLYTLIMYYLGLNDARARDDAYLCLDFLTKYDHGHFNHFEWFGLLNLKMGRPEEAKKHFKEAIKIFEDDPNWPLEDKLKHIARLKEEIAACSQPTEVNES